jgi:hypothetical protein
MAAIYEVLYNAGYGGFSFPVSFVEAVFEAYPPESALGAKLWRPSSTHFVSGDEAPDSSWANYYKIEGSTPFKCGYDRLIHRYFTKNVDGSYTCSRDPITGHYVRHNETHLIYFLRETHTTADEWCTSPEIIALAREHGLIGRRHDGGVDLQIASRPTPNI